MNGVSSQKMDGVSQLKMDGVSQLKMDGVSQLKMNGVSQHKQAGVSPQNMDGVSPAVRSLWRLIDLLQEEELKWSKNGSTVEEAQAINNQFTFDATNSCSGNSHIQDIINKVKIPTPMKNKHNAGVDNAVLLRRGGFRRNPLEGEKVPSSTTRVPSLKRYHAPSPPVSRDPDSTVCKIISTSDILPADQQGWLIDQLRGRKVWCAISQKHLHVFESDSSQASKYFIHLPRCQVRSLELKTVNQEGKVINGVARHFESKTIRVVDRFQFILENSVTRQKYMFGAASRNELTQWLSALGEGCGLDALPRESAANNLDSHVHEHAEMTAEERLVSFERRIRENVDYFSSPNVQIMSRRKPTFTNNNWSVFPSVSADDVRIKSGDVHRRFQKEVRDTNGRPSPLKWNHDIKEGPELDESFIRRSGDSRSSRPLLKLRSSFDVLFRRKKRSASADDAQTRTKLNSTPGHTETSCAARLPDGLPSVPSNLNQTFPSTATSSRKYAHDQNSISDSNPSLPGRRVDARRGRGLSLSLRRAASDFKDKLIGLVSPTDDTSKYHGTKCKDLTEIRMSGWLWYRKDHPKFTKMHCVLSRGIFYAFRSEREEEVSELAIVLNQSTVTYLAAVEGRAESLFTFKIVQPNCQGIFLSAEDSRTMMTWMMAMQLESAKILTDENSTSEEGETKQSLQDQLTRTTLASQAKLSQLGCNPAHTNRHSCPQIEDTALQGNDTNHQLQNESEKWTECSEEPNNNSVNRIQGCIKTGKPIDKYLSLQSLHLATNSTHDNQSSSESANSVHLRPPREIDKYQDHDNLVKTLAQCNDSAQNAEKLNLKDLTPFPRLSRSTLSSHSSPFRKQLNQTKLSNLKRSSSFGNSQLQQSSPGDVQKAVVNNSPLALEVNLSGKDHSFSVKDYPEDVLSLDTSATNQNNSEPSLKIDEPISELLLTNSDQSVIDCAQKPFRFDSSIHDDVVKEMWSTTEEMLLEVVKQKLRARERNETTNTQLAPSKDIVCIVNDQWNVRDTAEISSPVHAEQTMNTHPSNGALIGCDMGDCGQISTLGKPGQENVSHSPSKGRRQEGFLEMLGFGDQWQRHWCVLCNNCLCCYPTPEDKVPSEVIHLAGYDITLTSDHIQGRQCLLILKHLRKTRVTFSATCADDCREWYESIKLMLDSLNKAAIKQETLVQAGEDKQASSSEMVKQKLLAEVLRQKLELEKLHAARAGSKAETRASVKNSPVSPTLGMSAVTDEDKTCFLTRLTQRRMSTQIKLNAVQKQMETASISSKDKKIMFQIGKKKPDIVQGHSEIDGRRPDLEVQARLLSSKLREIDSCLLSHGAASPKIESRERIRNQRHSYDQALLKKIQLEAESGRDSSDDINKGTTLPKFKDKEKLKDINRNVSLKTSVQKLAHKTFAKANSFLSKKSMNQADGKGSPKASISNNLSDTTPDVIDGAKSNQTTRKFYGQDIPEPTDGFRSKNSFISGTLPGRHKPGSNQTRGDTILSKSLLSPSLTKVDNFSGMIRPSASLPMLSKLATKPEKETSQMLSNTDVITRLTNADLTEDATLLTLMGSSGQGIPGSLAQRRQVSASALAEIEAFEELSMKFLASDAGPK